MLPRPFEGNLGESHIYRNITLYKSVREREGDALLMKAVRRGEKEMK